MRFLSLFSGIEAASQAWLPLGCECVAVAEIEPFPCAVLKHHYPDVLNLGDVTKITEAQIKALGHIDAVILGFPCQDLSVAGKRKGLKNADGTNTRSGLFFIAMQICEWSRSRWIIGENVPGLFSSNGGRDFAAVVGELAGCGFDVPGDGWRASGMALGPAGLVEWFVLDAQWCGLAQRRKRVFIVRDSGNWSDRPPFFPLTKSLFRNPPTREKAGEELAPSLAARTRGGGGLGTDAECDGAVIPIQEIGKRQSGDPMNGVGHGQPGDPMFTLQAAAVHGVCAASTSGDGYWREGIGPLRGREQDSHENLVAHTLRAEYDASKDGSGRGTPLIPEIVTQAMSSKWSKGSSGPAGDEVANMIPVADPAISFERRMVRTTGGQPQEELNGCLRADENSGDGAPCVARGMQVRRLTPKECCRLQGFPDDYLDIEFRGKPATDGHKYKALGNSMAVPVIRWLGKRIELVHNL
jgi:DNA (cytosine-5)-methyltransferase 1